MAKDYTGLSQQLMFGLIRTSMKILSILIPPLAIRIAYNLFFTARPFGRPRHELPALESAKKEKINIDDMQIQLYEWGDGDKQVLFHHGWQGRGTSAAAFVEPLIVAGYKIVSFDGPAHGFSSGKQTNMIEFSHVLNTIVKRYGHFDALVAHSFGGMVTSYAHQTYNLDIDRFVFIGSPFSMNFIIESFADIINISHKIAYKMFERVGKRLNLTLEGITGETLAPKQDKPLLLIHDNDDVEVPIDQAKQQHKLWRGSKLIVTDGLGHRKILRDENVIHASIEFIKQKETVNS